MLLRSIKLFQLTAARRRLEPPAPYRRRHCRFNSQPPEGGWMIYLFTGNMGTGFQLTAARRRLAYHQLLEVLLYHRFNSQPPEGGWAGVAGVADTQIGFNSQPPEGGWGGTTVTVTETPSFNSQPPEGGWTYSRHIASVTSVSTHSRPKAAGRARPPP